MVSMLKSCSRQGDHCERGMLFAVNPGSSLPQFSANAGYVI
jgi:hypothetical protein